MALFFQICTFFATLLHFSSAMDCGEFTPAVLQSRIVNGELAIQGEFPWQVSIQRRAKPRLQGSINIHHPWDSPSGGNHHHPGASTNPINQWPSIEEILDATLWGKYFWAKLTPQNMSYMDSNPSWQANWPPPLPTHGPDNTIPPLPTHPPSHTQFPPMPPVPTFPPSSHWPPINNPGGGGWPPAIPGIPPNGQWPPPLPTYPPSGNFPPMPTFPPAHHPTRPPHIPSIPTFPPHIPSIPPHIPTRPPTIPPMPSNPPAINPPEDENIHGGPNDPIQPVLPFPTRPPINPQPQPPHRPLPPIPSRPNPPQIPHPQPQPQPPPAPAPGPGQNPGQGPPPPPPQNPNQKWQHFCGGSIIDRQWILTAAHCIQPMGHTFQPGQLRIVAGSVDWRNYDPVNAQVISVDRIVYHTSWTQQAGQHDIALLHLSQPLHYVKKDKIYVNRICLSNLISAEHSGITTSSGWGFLNKDQRQTPDALRKVNLPIVPNEQCRNAFSRVIGISQMQVCAGQSPKGNCMGDSGSPLIQKVSDKKVIQLGIVSFSIPCATPGYPDVFTRVSKYLDWIMSHTGLSLPQLTS